VFSVSEHVVVVDDVALGIEHDVLEHRAEAQRVPDVGLLPLATGRSTLA
jgi:hypothetical protein